MRRGSKITNLGDKRRPNWTFVVDVNPPGAPRKQIRKSGFKTKTEAQNALNDIVGALQRNDYVAPSKETLREYLEDWLAGHRSQVRRSTWSSYEMCVNQHVIPALGGVQLQALTRDRLNSFYADLLESGRRDGKGLSPKSIRNVHVVIRKALGDAVEDGKVTKNVAALAKPPKRRASSRKEMQTWDAQQLSFFLVFVENDDLYPLWHLDAHTGLRRGEVCGLHWRDVDLDGASISIVTSYVVVDYVPRFEEVKSDRSRRTVALDKGTVQVLRDHRKAQIEHRLAMGSAYEDNDLVFCCPDGSPIHPGLVSDRFDRLVKRSGLPRIRLHDLRHTHATLALKAGVPVKVVSERLGHASTSFTLDTYAHVTPGMQADAAEKVARLVFGGQE